MRNHYFEKEVLRCITFSICLWYFINVANAEEQRIQRRFMWKQMDNSMGGLMGRMFNGRIMKSMLGDLMPTKSTSTIGGGRSKLDFLPTETTRVKYIIRNPQTNKPMKIIKMRGTQKKLLKVVPVSKPMVEQMSNPTVKLNFPEDGSYEHRMRHLEREQEMIAEGKLPITSDEAILEKYFHNHKKPKGNHGNNDIITGKIMEYASWKPVYQPGENPAIIMPTSRPQIMSHLHTNINTEHELLPMPEKLVYQPTMSSVEDEIANEYAKQMHHTYEVTEPTAEESAESQELPAVMPVESLSGFVPSHGVQHQSQQQQQPRERTKIRERTRTTPTSTQTTTTSTTEEPNYPPAFLKKFREREQQREISTKSRLKSREIIESDNSWQPTLNVNFSTSNSRTRVHEQQQHQQHQQKQQHYHQNQQQKSQQKYRNHDAIVEKEKWPADISSYVTIAPSAMAYIQATSSELGSAEDKPRNENDHLQGRKLVRLKSAHPVASSKTEHKLQNARQRGTIKFGDKINYDEI